MRQFVLAFVATFLTLSANAQGIDRPNRVSAFLSNVSAGWSEGGGSFLDAGYGVAYERRVSRVWAVELAATIQEQEDAQTYPFDLVARYSFPTVRTRWRPYVGGGVRYVAAPGPEPRGELYENVLAPEIAAGVDYHPSPEWSLRFDAKHTVGNTYEYDDPLKVSVGIGRRF